LTFDGVEIDGQAELVASPFGEGALTPELTSGDQDDLAVSSLISLEIG
jgi:hypothetical protein